MKNAALLRISTEPHALAGIRRFVGEQATALGADAQMVDAMVLAANEIGTNIIQHGYRGQPGMIEIEVDRVADTLVVRLRDQAPPFDPTRVPPPDLAVPLYKRSPGGLGIHLARHMADAMLYRITPEGGNELTLVKQGLARQGEPEDEYGPDC